MLSIKETLEQRLQGNFNAKLGEIHFKYFQPGREPSAYAVKSDPSILACDNAIDRVEILPSLKQCGAKALVYND